jgi:hypothetical protein
VQIVRLPGSGGEPLAAVRRSLAGPLKTCIAPLLLILAVIVVWAVREAVVRRKRRDATEADERGAAIDAAASADE